jgi:hypothetical protein
LLQSDSYSARITKSAYVFCLFIAFLTVIAFMPDVREYMTVEAGNLYSYCKFETRTGYEVDRDAWLVWPTFFQGYTNAWRRMMSDNYFTKWYDYFYTPPTPPEWGRIGVAAVCTLLIAALLLATLSFQRSVVYIAQGRFNSTTLVEISTELLRLLYLDPDIQPRHGISGEASPASLESAVRYTMLKYDTTNLTQAVLQHTMDCYLQERMLQAARSRRFKSHTTGLPSFRRVGGTGLETSQ